MARYLLELHPELVKYNLQYRKKQYVQKALSNILCDLHEGVCKQ